MRYKTIEMSAADYRRLLGLQPAGSGRPARRRGTGQATLAVQIMDAASIPDPQQDATGWTPEGLPRYELDFYWPEHALAVEIDGRVHGIREHLERDRRKDVVARIAGIELWRFTPLMVREGFALRVLLALFESRRDDLRRIACEYMETQKFAQGGKRR